MSHRQADKEQRRKERLAKEAAAKQAARRKRSALIGGAVALLAVGGVAAALTIGGGGDKSSNARKPGSASLPSIPAQQESDLTKAAAAAGCTLSNPAIEGSNHEVKTFKASDYRTNPPTSGTHYPSPASDGVYETASPPALGESVHALEHGRIEVQYAARTPARTVRRFESLLAEQAEGYHMLLFANTTNMKFAVAATAWGHSLGCPKMNDKVFDAIRTFRSQYIDQGPETVP